MRTVQNRLDELGSGVPIDPQERVQLMWSMITDYCEICRNTIRGKFDKKLQTYFEHVGSLMLSLMDLMLWIISIHVYYDSTRYKDIKY